MCFLYFSIDQLNDYEGHHLKFISVPYFPSVDFHVIVNDVSVPVIPLDSIEVRLANSFALKQNFT